jgi:hypothetical protein
MRRLARFTFSALLFLFSAFSNAVGSGCYVRLASTTGSDNGDCTGSLCATIACAITQAASGDIIAATRPPSRT